MNRWNVTATKIPISYNDPLSFVVEAENADDAKELVRRELKDLSTLGNYVYEAAPYAPREIAGRIVARGI